MSEGTPLKVTVESVEAEPRKTGHRYVDMIVAGAAILISLVSLGVAVKHGLIMERLVAANSWPLLQYSTGNVDKETGKASITMNIENVGVGPAVVKQFHLIYRARRYKNSGEFLKACCQYTGGNAPNVLSAPIDRTVIKAGDEALFLGLDRDMQTETVWQRLNKERFEVGFDVCYCSVFGECWRSDLVNVEPSPVDNCSAVARPPS